MLSRRRVLRLGAVGSVGSVSLLSGCTDWFTEREANAPGQEGPAPPATFDFAYSSSEGTLTVALENGAELPPENVYLRGTGLDQTGSWASLGGDTTGSDNTIEVGNKLVVGAVDDFEARIVWEGNGEAETYNEATGPGA